MACDSNPCKNGGTCVNKLNSENGYHCNCTDSFTGTRCEVSTVCEYLSFRLELIIHSRAGNQEEKQAESEREDRTNWTA